ncbi:hypothetical protein GCM10022254_14820 [Actinomadura meridiana]|uniref:TPM domain-containing protein n=1 Tax=Actinomadura meridiana TaxID=559626 RepID=A0ABP8BV91_9ACTN
MRRGWIVLMIGFVLTCLPAPALAMERAKPVSRVDHLAAELGRDPVYVTDHAPRALPPDASAQIKKAIGRLGVPTYVAVTPTYLVDGYDAEDLVPLLHDSVGRPGLYIVVDPTSSAMSAIQYGGDTLPVRDAKRATLAELPTDATAVTKIERFVDIALSGDITVPTGPPPKSKVRLALDAHDRSERDASRTEWGVFAGGTALSGVTILFFLQFGRTIKRRKRR